jgi:hypothetical protein
MHQAMLEFTFPHVTRSPCHDAISFRETILELAVESATRKANVSDQPCENGIWLGA